MRESTELVVREREKAGPVEPYVYTEEPDDYGYEQGAQGGGGIKLQAYLRALLKYSWLILLIAVVGTALAVVYVAQMQDVYVAAARVQVNREFNPALGASKTGSVVVSDNDPSHLSTQFQILEGSGLLRRVVKTYDLEHNQAFLNPGAGRKQSTWQNVLRFLGVGEQEAQISTAKGDRLTLAADSSAGAYEDSEEEAERLAPYVSRLRSGLAVAPVREKRVQYSETRLIDIAYTHRDPRVAAMIANAIADTYVLQNMERRVDNNSKAGAFLSKRVAELQAQIRSGEERLINYSKQNQLLSLDSEQNTVVARLTDLNRRLMEAENERQVAEAAYRSGIATGAARAVAEDSDPQVSQLEAKRGELRQQRERLLSEFVEEAPEIKNVEREIALVEKDLAERRGRKGAVAASDLENKYRQAAARENELRALFAQQRRDVMTQNEAAINYRIIQQEIETNKQLLDGLLQRSKENDFILNDTPNNVLVLDRALVPGGPAGPRRAGRVLMALVLSLGLGVGLALLLHYLDDRVTDAEEIEQLSQLSVLGTVPSYAGLSGVARYAPFKLLGRRQGDKNSLNLATREGAPAVYTESFLHLRTSILLATAGGPPQKLLVTSSQPSEGKTNTAINLASALAQTGAKVLLLDCDLRRPSIHRIFGLDNRGGLTNLLASKDFGEMEIFNSIQQEPETGVHVLTTGPASPSPSNLLGSARMRQLMDVLAGAYTHIVIDSPPLVLFTDSTVLSSMVDGTLLVVRSGYTSRKAMTLGRRILKSVGARIFGIVVNDVPTKGHSYYMNDYYGDSDGARVEDASTLGLSA